MLPPQLRNPAAGRDTLRKVKKLDSKPVGWGGVGRQAGGGGKYHLSDRERKTGFSGFYL